MNNFNYGTNFIFLRSNWFDNLGEEDNQYKRLGEKCFYLYLTLFRFLVNNQEYKYTFITSIEKLRKISGYSDKDIFTYIRLMVSEGVIDTDNTDHWERWFEGNKLNGKLKSKECITIVATAVPNVVYDSKAARAKTTPVDDHPDNKYVMVDLRLMQLYQDRGFNEKYYPIFCLINKRSNGTEGKCTQAINTMARDLGMGDSTVHNIIKVLNENYLLASSYRDNGKDGKKFEHRILNNIDLLDTFAGKNFHGTHLKEVSDKNVKRWNKPKDKKKKVKKKEYIDKGVAPPAQYAAEDYDNDDPFEELPFA
jgi:hypothetical protein